MGRADVEASGFISKSLTHVTVGEQGQVLCCDIKN
jgi:hypothetical protein